MLAGGLAGLTAEGETALYDTLIYALHYFSGLSGKRTLVVLTDGADSKSTYTYEDALEFARRAGVVDLRDRPRACRRASARCAAR